VAGRIVSMKNSNDTIGNRNRDLPTCSAVPQPTALPRAPESCSTGTELNDYLLVNFVLLTAQRGDIRQKQRSSRTWLRSKPEVRLNYTNRESQSSNSLRSKRIILKRKLDRTSL